jgi:trans-2,3-dihydro-3-hydroxyanthranilate isomerase
VETVKQVRVYHVDAFTDQPFGGNPAGVVPDADGLDETTMQRIARELNLSETAFLLPTDNRDADYRVRYFTPTTEIDFCGHATVGLAWILATEYGWAEKAEQVVFETNKGHIPVAWSKQDGKVKAVTMTQVSPKVRNVDLDLQEAARLAGIPAEQLDDRFPVRLGYTGNWHLLIPVKSRAAIDAAEPRMAELGEMNRLHGISTTHLFTFDSPDGYDLYTRDFAPAVGIPEDPVTGAANGALAGYLVLEGILNPRETHHLTIGQGHAIGRPGTLYVTIRPANPDPVVQVGGSAVMTISGTLNLP